MDINGNSRTINAITGNTPASRAGSVGNNFAHTKTESAHSPLFSNSSDDVVSISPAAHKLHEIEAASAVKAVHSKETENTENTEEPSKTTKSESQAEENSKSNTKLSEEDLKQVQELKQRDQEVRTHEAAHLAAAGKYATGGASFDYKRGPDGKNYAVGGEVGIDTSPIPNDPQATLQKAQQIRAAAQAPANPSSQDRQVAASASQMEAKARQEISQQALEKTDGTSENESSTIKDVNTEKNSSGNTGSASASESNPENNNVNKNAVSTYKNVDDISKAVNDAASLIELIA